MSLTVVHRVLRQRAASARYAPRSAERWQLRRRRQQGTTGQGRAGRAAGELSLLSVGVRFT